MTSPYPGLRVVLLARFNRRYHRTGPALQAALEGLGAEVTCVEERTRGVDRLLGRSLERRLALAVRRARPDLVLAFKGECLTPASVPSLRALHPARWAVWWPDSPHALALSMRVVRAYDHAFVFDSWMVDRHREAGIPSVYLAEGFDPAYARPLARDGAPRARLAYVGSREPLRDTVVESIRDLGLEPWGPGWPRGPLFGDAFVRAFSEADIALNVHQFFGEGVAAGRYGHGANRRVFELAGIGTVQLCDAKADVHRHFQEGTEIVLFRDAAELRAHARELLADPARRASIAAAARARALREHTWTHRLVELLTATVGR